MTDEERLDDVADALAFLGSIEGPALITFPAEHRADRARDALDAFRRLRIERDNLLAACRAALRWIARNTHTVGTVDPILGPIADEADRVRAQIRDAIDKADGKEGSRDG